MIPQPKTEWFGDGLQWTARHQTAFSALSIYEPDPADPLHYAIGQAMTGAVPERYAEVLRILSGVLAGEMMREGTRAGKMKTAAEAFLAETVDEYTRAPYRLTATAATRRAQITPAYQKLLEGRRVSEYRVRALVAYLGTVREQQRQALTDQVDARKTDAVEGWEAT